MSWVNALNPGFWNANDSQLLQLFLGVICAALWAFGSCFLAFPLVSSVIGNTY